MAANDPKEMFGAYHFRVELFFEGGNEKEALPFKSCSGLKVETQVVDVEEGGFNTTTRKIIGRTKYPNIVLKQGFCGANSVLWKKYQKFLNDAAQDPKEFAHGRATPDRFNGVIVQLGPEVSSGKRSAAKWMFSKGWICKWEGPDLDASKNEISIETIEIAHEGLYLMSGNDGFSEDNKK